MEDEQVQPESGHGGLDRRRFLLGAGAVSAAAFAVPTIITIAPAGAASLTSPPPQPPGPPEVEVLPNRITDPPVAVAGIEDPGTAVAPKTEVLAARTGLPLTGAEVGALTAAGLAATAGGAALHVWSAKAGLHEPPPATGPAAPAPETP
jgi:hypothetical protein